MIVKIKIKDINNEESTMLFGTSYKNYLDQLKDFFYSSQIWINNLPHPVYSISSIERSNAEWKSWGGLKWCAEKHFQEQLNREGCQLNEPNNPHPRQYSKMKFETNYHAIGKIMGWYNLQYHKRELLAPKAC